MIIPEFKRIQTEPINSLSPKAKEILMIYGLSISKPQEVQIGSTTLLEPMYDGEKPPQALREYTINYPETLIEAYRIACDNYDRRYMDVVERHKQWPTDYQYAPHTLVYQVDGPAYSDEFLEYAFHQTPETLAEFINARAFEYEPNVAMYGLNGRLWPEGSTNQTWNEALEIIRKSTGKKVAVLAVTEEKLREMLISELGINEITKLPEETIRDLTGFDAFMGPNDLLKQYAKHGGEESDYVYFGRTSRPKSWLRNPTTENELPRSKQRGIRETI